MRNFKKKKGCRIRGALLSFLLVFLTSICVYVNLKLGLAHPPTIKRSSSVAIEHGNTPAHDVQRQLPPLIPHDPPPPQQQDDSRNVEHRQFEHGRTQTPVGGAFVHVGKTAGSTISVLLRNGCHSWVKHPCRNVTHETVASRRISSYYHVADFGLLTKSHHDFYVVTLRNPLDRVISAFLYEHPRNIAARNETSQLNPYKFEMMKQGYEKCFPTLEDFVQHLDGGNSNQFHYPYRRNEIHPEPSCRDFARAAFHGRIRPFNHLYFNFQRIKDLIPSQRHPPPTILVTRQESLWKDWISVNRYLGQDEKDIILPIHSNSSHSQGTDGAADTQQEQRAHIRDMQHYQLPVTRDDLTPRATQILCKALQQEFGAYFWFLSRAKNLNRQDLLDTIVKARATCPQLKLDFKSLAA